MQKTNNMLVIPAYFYPDNKPDKTGSWDKLNKAAVAIGKQLVVIANVHNGPLKKHEDGSRTVDENYEKTLTQLSIAGATIIGYVHVKNGKRDRNLIMQDIQDWLDHYPHLINGIFFDECHIQGWPADNKNYFLNLYNDTANKFKNKHTILEKIIYNPGVIPDESYVKHLSNPYVYWCPFEQTYDKFSETKEEVYSFAKENKSVVLLYDAKLDPVPLLETVQELEQNNIKGFDITSDVLDLRDKEDEKYPWNQLTNYFEELVKTFPQTTKIRCQFHIEQGWYWQNGAPINGQHDQINPNTFRNTLVYDIEVPVDSKYWYVMPLAVNPNNAFGYGFVQLKEGKLCCRVEARGSNGWFPKYGLNEVSFGGLTLTASLSSI